MDFIVLSKVLITGEVSVTTPFIVLKELLRSIGYSMNDSKAFDETDEKICDGEKEIHIKTKDRYLLSIIDVINHSQDCHVIPGKKFPQKFISLFGMGEDPINYLYTLHCAQRGKLYYKTIDPSPAVMYGLLLRNTKYRQFDFECTEKYIKDVFKEFLDMGMINLSLVYKKDGFLKMIDYLPITTDNILMEMTHPSPIENNISIIINRAKFLRVDVSNNVEEAINSPSVVNPRKGLMSMDNYFNPIFPFEMYRIGELHSHCLSIGIPLTIPEEMYNSLCFAHATVKTFYTCNEVYQPLKEETTITGDPLSQVEDSLVYYGIKAERLVPMYVMDLLNCFKATNSLQNPYSVEKSFFLVGACKRLIKIVDFGELNATVERIIREEDVLTDSIELFKRNVSQTEAAPIFNDLLHLGFYMRGWKGQLHPIPLIDTNVENQDEVDSNVCTKWREIQEKYNKSSIWNNLMDLPILDWSVERDFFIASGVGRTSIRGLLDLVFSDQRNQEVNSCIRMSSNYLCYSSYFYIVRVFKNSPPFEISRMRRIS